MYTDVRMKTCYTFLYLDCGDPGYSANGTRNLTDTTEGSLVTYTCDLGYRIIGNNSRECKRDRMWSGRSPVCQGKD